MLLCIYLGQYLLLFIVSAIFYVQIALEYLPKESRQQVKLTVEPIVYFVSCYSLSDSAYIPNLAQMVFTSILVHGVTVPMSKVLMHGVTLTRTMTQPDEVVKRKPQVPVNINDIQRIDIPAPPPTYNGMVGGTRSGHTTPPEPILRSRANSIGARDRANRDAEHSVEFAPEPKGHTIA